MVVREGKWGPVVYGDGILGGLVPEELLGGNARLKILLRVGTDITGRTPAPASFSLELELQSDTMKGNYTGSCAGIAVSGRVVGALFRDLPSTSL